jgi:hypothetical protein
MVVNIKVYMRCIAEIMVLYFEESTKDISDEWSCSEDDDAKSSDYATNRECTS